MKTRALIIGILLLTLQRAFAQPPLTGPTAYFGYNESAVVKNSIDVFMYFIPLTSPARVRLEKSSGNSQEAWITAYSLQQKGDGFNLRCSFTIGGEGFYVNDFNPEDIMAINARDLDRPETTVNIDYMRIEDGGYGALEISGNYTGGIPVITALTVDFSDRGAKSPLSIGLYSVDPVDGVYAYENRYNLAQARISSLSFQKTVSGEVPRMAVKLSTLGNARSPDGFFAGVKAVFANLFVTPIEITPVGNNALFDFAMALLEKADKFTFPYAENLVENR